MKIVYYIFACLLIILVSSGYGQDTTQAAPSGDIIDLSGAAIQIRTTIEKPRVKIVTERIKPEFNELTLEKSFLNELLGGGEAIEYIPREEEMKNEIIDLEKIVNRTR